jgi:hypothetical protein
MSGLILAAVLALLYALLLGWACRTLPEEKWQVLAAVPLLREGPGVFKGFNLTYYGFFSASAQTAAAGAVLFLMGSVGQESLATVLALAPVMGVGLVAARVVARVVEKKPRTFTVGGAFFVALFLAPGWAWGAGRLLNGPLAAADRVAPFLAAIAVAYALGEGLGRLACISFGCCYGRPLDQCPAWVQKVFGGHAFVFDGPNKKIAYESGLGGVPVVPIQAVSSAVLVATGLAGMILFLNGWFQAAFILPLAVSQGWRVFSETLRADYRGGSRISAYQWMAGAAVLGGLALILALPEYSAPQVHLEGGLKALWSPGTLLALQVLWIGVMLYLGRSRVTASTIRFHLVRPEI